jgi:hypothetical protein
VPPVERAGERTGGPDELGPRAAGPRAGDHALQLYTRPLHPELVPLARGRRLEGEGWRARVGLLRDTGHLIELVLTTPGEGPEARRLQPRAVVEVVAPVALDLPAASRIDIRRVGASSSGVFDEGGAVAYVCSWSYEQKDAAEFARVHGKVLAGGPARGERLVVNRGHPENEGLAPFSTLDLVLDPDAGRIDTFVVHAFPADHAFLFVQSVLRTR